MYTLDDFDFELPEELIALRPVRPRQASRMLVSNGEIIDAKVSDLPNYLRAGDLLVFNNTKFPRDFRGKGFAKRRTGPGWPILKLT